MALSDAEFDVIRSWVGDAVTDDVLDERMDRLGNIDAVVLETLRHRKAQLVNDEPGVLVADGITINQTENMRSLNNQIDAFTAAGGTGLESEEDSAEILGLAVYQMARPDRTR